jgi:hypothetical protein
MLNFRTSGLNLMCEVLFSWVNDTGYIDYAILQTIIACRENVYGIVQTAISPLNKSQIQPHPAPAGFRNVKSGTGLILIRQTAVQSPDAYLN